MQSAHPPQPEVDLPLQSTGKIVFFSSFWLLKRLPHSQASQLQFLAMPTNEPKLSSPAYQTDGIS